MINVTKVIMFILLSSFTLCAAMFEGDDCVMLSDNGGGGKCISLKKCDEAKRLLKEQKVQPQTCGFIGNVPLVCCPKSSIKTSPNIPRSEKKCQEYHNVRSIKTGIAFGEKAKAREFPHMAALGYGNNKILWLCGGSLISDRFVLTAAHCTRTIDSGDPNVVRLGDLKLNVTNDGAAPQDIPVDNIFVHPDYKPPSHYHDIALLKLKASATFGWHVRPACIHNHQSVLQSTLQAIGWGKTDFYGNVSDHLLKVLLQIIEYAKCVKMYSNVSTRRLPNGIDTDTQICAGDASGGDTCPGDSGGPLQYLKRGSSDVIDHFVVVGITSFGKGCGFENSAGVYTKVSAYRSWIENIVWPVN